ncbi:hypothetical protein KC906_00525 [Candidatus Kaiserbacteria bacterium]|nr:hypothetical protein [Candidatus Kaiserbacteria bacterium]MCB9812437.1 hypothetical protein [Candidatus Nomurabacteria bacterium]
MDKGKFQDIASKIFKSSEGLHKPRMISPGREWAIGIVVSVLIVLTSALWTVHTYDRFKDSTIKQTTPVEEQAVVYRESLVDTALGIFTERAQRHAALSSQQVVLPSSDLVLPPQEEDEVSAEITTIPPPDQLEPIATEPEEGSPTDGERAAVIVE